MKKQKKPNQEVYTAKPKARDGSKLLIAILLLHIILALTYWHFTGFGTPPDEAPHAAYIQHFVGEHTLPVYSASNSEGYEFYQPPLYYLLGTPFFLLGKLLGLENPVMMVRLLSLLLGALSIFIVYRAIKTAFPEEGYLPVSCAAFVALLPTHVMMSSSVSNDILMEVVFGLFLLVSASILTRGLSWKTTVFLGAVLGLGILSKMTCRLLFPVAAIVYLLLWKREGISHRALIGHFLIAMIVSLLIGGWWLGRNYLVYGDLFALSQLENSFKMHSALPEYWFIQGWSLPMYLAWVVMMTFISFWGVFGHMNIFMPTWIYNVLAGISLVALISSRWGIADLKERSKTSNNILTVYFITLLLVLLAFLRLNTTVFQAQGRYLYPALIPISLLMVTGIRRMIPSKHRNLIPYIITGMLIAVQIIALATCIIPS